MPQISLRIKYRRFFTMPLVLFRPHGTRMISLGYTIDSSGVLKPFIRMLVYEDILRRMQLIPNARCPNNGNA